MGDTTTGPVDHGIALPWITPAYTHVTVRVLVYRYTSCMVLLGNTPSGCVFYVSGYVYTPGIHPLYVISGCVYTNTLLHHVCATSHSA